MPAKGENQNHWNASARLVLRGFVAWVASAPDGPRDLPEVYRLLHLPLAPEGAESDPGNHFDDLLDQMTKEPDRAYGVPAHTAAAILGMAAEEMGSVLSTVRQNILFLSSPPMARMLSADERQPKLQEWKFGGQTIYLCLPASRLHRHSRFYRLFLNRLLAAVEAVPEKPEIPALMMLDEMHVLGHMQAMETAAGLIAGYGVRIYSIWQDFNQLEAIYGDIWETFLGNAAVLQAFALNDSKTLKYVSERLGETTIVTKSFGEISKEQASKGFSGTTTGYAQVPLLSASEIAAFFARDRHTVLTIFPGDNPMLFFRVNYWGDAFRQYRVDYEALQAAERGNQ